MTGLHIERLTGYSFATNGNKDLAFVTLTGVGVADDAVAVSMPAVEFFAIAGQVAGSLVDRLDFGPDRVRIVCDQLGWGDV